MNSRPLSFDHLVGAWRAASRHCEAERLGGLQVDHQLVLGRRLYRQVGRLLTFEDAIDIAGGAPELIDEVWPVGDQAARWRRNGVYNRSPATRAGPQARRSNRVKTVNALAVTIMPPCEDRANAATDCSISPVLCMLTGTISTPTDGAADWIAPNGRSRR